MTELQKYKQIVAVILLTVYTFIATPVQWWHHHNYAADAASSLQQVDEKKISVPDAENKSIEDNCQICSHHYSIYNYDDDTVFKIFASAINPKEGFYALAIPFAPYFNSANKGPPALA